MIGAPQQANAKRATSSTVIEVIGKANAFRRLVDNPSDAVGFDQAEIGDVVMMRKVDNKRVDRYGW
jgi:hypothetical protein